ncbi:MAG TPA: TRAM domain-containing protein [Methanobacterium sp.]|nr:MAG: TRAM domain-containing protein [Methanobacterium sp.]HOI72484.1 TRAM domain-containing protein [Methanobacterium sp.]HPX77636.1 TRAM domain-containing protein [Methanobacterium sp.]
MFRTDDGPKTAPIQEGEEYEVKIEDVGKEGDGITRIEGFVVFVPDTKVGDEVKVRITSVRRRFAFGEKV